MALSTPITTIDDTVNPTASDDGFAIGTIWVNTSTGLAFVMVDDTPSTAIWTPVAGSGTWIEDEFLPTNGQITFIISQAPSDPASLMFIVNGVAADDVADFTISGQTITWTNASYTMEASDLVTIRYR